MIKLTKIKYLISHPRLGDMPKYMAFIGLVFTAISPLQMVAQAQVSQASRPALFAMAEARPILYSEQTSDIFPILNGSVLVSQVSPIFAGIPVSTKSPKSTTLAVMQSDVSQSQNVIDVKRNVIVTAYSSTVDQCDSSPFITAKGTHVRDGIVAANWLPFGTKVRLPEIYGDKIFVVEDRMAKKNSHKLDVWMETRTEALQFGKRTLTVEILE